MPSPQELESARKILSWIDICKSFALAFVAIGVAVEFVVDRLERPYLRKIEDARQLQIANLTTQAAEANDRAGKATERAAQLEREAAEIAESVAPRRLTLKQQALLGSRLEKFAGRRFVIFSDPNDSEAGVFASDIYGALKLAKWEMTGKPGGLVRGGQTAMTVPPDLPSSGVGIPCGPKDVETSGKAFVRALSEMGFDAFCAAKWTNEEFIEVLARPLGPQGEAKLRREREAKATQKQKK